MKLNQSKYYVMYSQFSLQGEVCKRNVCSRCH